MPMIGTNLGTSVSAVQNAITADFVAFGLAQLVYGHGLIGLAGGMVIAVCTILALALAAAVLAKAPSPA
jgi:hypothetical protein